VLDFEKVNFDRDTAFGAGKITKTGMPELIIGVSFNISGFEVTSGSQFRATFSMESIAKDSSIAIGEEISNSTSGIEVLPPFWIGVSKTSCIGFSETTDFGSMDN